MLLAEQWSQRHVDASLEIGAPAAPWGADFAAVLRPHDACRADAGSGRNTKVPEP